MKKFAKILDNESKLCSVGLGTDTEFYHSIGMTEQEVEQGYDGRYYLAGYAPEKTQNIINSECITELQNYLNATDWYAVRFAETGAEIPEDIKAARQSAREEISRLRGDDDQDNSQMDPLH